VTGREESLIKAEEVVSERKNERSEPPEQGTGPPPFDKLRAS
jgi:hypothetical protein